MDYFWLLAPLQHFIDQKERVFLLYLATSFLLALLVQWMETRQRKVKLLSRIIAPEVYTHPSAKVDYLYYIANTILYAFIIGPFQFLGPQISQQVYTLLQKLAVAASLQVQNVSPLTVFFVGLLLTLASDFSTFFAHYLAHRIPWLWEFHKVHHSAEVMTPITVYRMHPVDDIFTLCVGGVIVGALDACVRFYFAPGISPHVLYGVNAALFLFYLTGYHLRHSHVWFSYGPLLSRLLISPAQHQIHHSNARRHWDKNFGFIFSFWDSLFGSLYVPKEKEELTFGLGEGRQEDIQYRSVARLYFLPFKKAALRLIKRS